VLADKNAKCLAFNRQKPPLGMELRRKKSLVGQKYANGGGKISAELFY
jgi:hypothetical protein